MDFRILGPLEAHAAAGPLPLGGAKPRALLALLLLNANQVVSSNRLIEELWGEQPPDTATTALQGHVSALRKLLEPGRARGEPNRVLLTRPPGYLLQIEPEQLDLRRFERLRSTAREAFGAGDVPGAQAKLEQALSLWRGGPLADLVYEPFAQTEIARLEELRLGALEERIEADLALGCHSELIGELEALTAEHPLRERFLAQLMLALYRAGRQAEALEAHRESRRALVGELGIEPGRELQELERAILTQDPSLDLASPGSGSGAAAEADEADEAPSRGIFVGRELELAELVTGIDDAFAGRGRLFLLAGEPGLGKSRLAEEVVANGRARGARVLIGRCWEAGGAPPYWPWVQALRVYVREGDPAALGSQLGAGAADLAQIVPELRQRFPDLPQPPSLESEGARFRLFDATAEFLRNASQARPIVLILDDLHAADASSLLLLQFLARELGSTRTLVVGAYRDAGPTPGEPLTATLAELLREPVTRRLSLGGLSAREVEEYVERAASEIASPELVTALGEKTEGNPLFVGEIVRLLSVQGVRFERTADVRLAIPQSVRDVIARRLTHLSRECNRLLMLASVVGREFAPETLARMGGGSEEELLETLDEAVAARVVSDVPGGPGCLRFAHVLIRDTLYEGLTSARRVRLHRLAAEALEALCGEERPYLAELAYHSIAGRDFDKGVRYARSAGERALALVAYEESARLYERALEALDLGSPGDEKARYELFLSLGEAEARAGDTPAAKRAFLDAAGIARALGLPRELARAAAGYGGRVVWARAGDDDRLVPLLEEGLAALGDEDVELRARLMARLAGALRDEHSRDRRDALSREAVRLARRTNDPTALAFALDGRAAAIVATDTVAEGLALGSELRAVAEQSGDRERAISGQMWRIIAQLMVGDIRGAEVDLAAARTTAQELRQPAPFWEVCGAQAMLALAAGKLTEAELLVAEAFALGERAQPEGAIPVYRLQRYTLCDFRGGLEEIEPEICDLVARYPARPAFRCALAHILARLGRTADARRALDDLAADDFSALPFDQEWLYGMSLLAETSALLRDTDSAAVLYRLLLPWAAFNVVDVAEGFRGSVSRYLGMLAAMTQRRRKAELHFEDAITLNARMGARPWLAHTQHDYGRMLLADDEVGHGERALELVGQALTTYRELGMQGWAQEAFELEQRLRPGRAPGH